MKTVSASRQIP